MKRTVSRLRSVLTAFSLLSIAVCAAKPQPQPLLVYDLLKYDTDGAAKLYSQDIVRMSYSNWYNKTVGQMLII